MKKCLKWISVGVLLSAVGVAASSWWVLRQTRHVPDFYRLAAQENRSVSEAASRRLRQDFERLKSDASELGTWRAAFSDEEINAWLAEELPKTLPRLLAGGAQKPRILIEDDRVLAAARVKNRRIETVISCEVEVELTEQPNVLAIRISKLRAGALELPLERFLQNITNELAKGDIDVQWDLTDDGPVALLTIPSERPEYVRTPVIVESVRLVDGHMLLAGNTGELAHQAYAPRGPVHRFVSYRIGEKRSRQTARAGSSSDNSSHLR